ncbi:MAG: serine/threonine-protein phosphatase, partial [Frisingicoccus sp.]|nr:serine/threonine-protein phosphatase [Frisingicoccus sp.]
HTFKLLRRFDEGDIDEEFFDALDANNGGAKLARILLEDCTEVNLFVGKANNEANYEGNALFDISIRKNLVVQLKEILEHLGKQVKITYY